MSLIGWRRRLWPRMWVYSTASWARATLAATGRPPLTSPPMSAERLLLTEREAIQAAEVIYLNLHGYEDRDWWEGEDAAGDRVVALAPENLAGLDLSGAFVFAENCYGGLGPLREAFLVAGARAFVGAVEETYGRRGFRIGEADLIGHYFLRAIRWEPVGSALSTALGAFARRTPREMSEEERLTMGAFRVWGDPEARLWEP